MYETETRPHLEPHFWGDTCMCIHEAEKEDLLTNWYLFVMEMRACQKVLLSLSLVVSGRQQILLAKRPRSTVAKRKLHHNSLKTQGKDTTKEMDMAPARKDPTKKKKQWEKKKKTGKETQLYNFLEVSMFML